MTRRPYSFVPVDVPRERRRRVGSLVRSLWRSRFLRFLFWLTVLIVICAGGYFLIACIAVIILGMFGVRFGLRRRGAYRWEQETRQSAPRNPYDLR